MKYLNSKGFNSIPNCLTCLLYLWDACAGTILNSTPFWDRRHSTPLSCRLALAFGTLCTKVMIAMVRVVAVGWICSDSCRDLDSDPLALVSVILPTARVDDSV